MQGGVRKRAQAPVGAIQTGQTYHVAGTYDGTTSRLYINGVEVAALPLTGAIGTTSNGLYIASWNGSNEFLKGTVDDVAVYQTALSAARVKAHNDLGGSTPPPPPPVAAPGGLAATAVADTQVNLTWTDNASNETQQVLERSTSSSFASPTAIQLPENVTSYNDSGRAPSTTYYYRVKALNASDTSGWSNTATATTPATPPPPPPPSNYATTVGADNPIAWWRLGEASGATAVDQKAANPGTYFNAPTLGAASLLGSDTANKAVTFDGTNDYARIANSTALNISTPITLEAWIKPTTLPRPGPSRRSSPSRSSTRCSSTARCLSSRSSRWARASAFRRPPVPCRLEAPITWSAPSTAPRGACT